MALVRRKWTPAAADEWTREDWIAVVLSPFAYTTLAVGVALSILLLRGELIILGVAAVLIALMQWIIDWWFLALLFRGHYNALGVIFPFFLSL